MASFTDKRINRSLSGETREDQVEGAIAWPGFSRFRWRGNWLQRASFGLQATDTKERKKESARNVSSNKRFPSYFSPRETGIARSKHEIQASIENGNRVQVSTIVPILSIPRLFKDETRNDETSTLIYYGTISNYFQLVKYNITCPRRIEIIWNYFQLVYYYVRRVLSVKLFRQHFFSVLSPRNIYSSLRQYEILKFSSK